MHDISKSTSVRERLGGSLVTESQRAFLDTADNDVDLFVFVSQQLDSQMIMEAVLAGFKENRSAKLRPTVVVAHLGAMGEMVFCRFVENVLVYLADILREVLRKQPAILSSSERITVERLVKASSVEELIHEAIEDKVSSLSHAGFKDLADWFAQRSIPLANVDAKLHEYVAVRNMLVHNRGRVDERFLRSTKDQSLRKGERIFLNTKYIGASTETLGRFVSVSDDLIAQKFSLDRLPY